MRRKLFKIAIYATVALVLLALLAYLARDPLRDTLVKVVSRQLSSSFDGSLQIGKLRGTLLTSLVLQDIVLRDQQGVVAQVETVRLAYSLFAVLKRQVTVLRADIVRPRLSLTQAADGTWNVTRLFPPATPQQAPPDTAPGRRGFPFAVRLKRMQILDGEVALNTPVLPGVRRIEGLHLQLAGRLGQDGLQVALQRLTARALPAEVEVQTQGTLRGWAGGLHVDDLRLQTAQTLVTLSGALPGGDRVASLALQLQPLDLTEIGRLLQDDAVQGQVRMTLKATGPPEALAVDAQLRTADGRVDLQSQVNLSAVPLRYRATLDVAHLNLAAFVQRAALQSDINLRLRLDGAGISPAEMQGQAQFNLLPSHLGRIVMQPSEVHLEATPQQFQVHRFDLNTSVARMRMSGAVNLTGKSDLRYHVTADLAHLQPLLAVDELGGEVLLQGGVSGELQAVNADGVLEVKQLRYQVHRLEALRLTYDGAQLGTAPQVKAELVARQARVGELPVEQFTLQATYDDNTRQAHFNADVQQAPGYGGKTAGRVTLGDKSQDVVLEELIIHLAKRTWQAVAPLHVALAPQEVHIKQFHLAHGNETLQLSGALQAQHLQDLRLTASRVDLSALRTLFPLPDMLAGRATLNVQMSGTLSEPLLQVEAEVQSATAGDLPFERLHTTLAYAGKQLRSELSIRQAQREVVTVRLQLPVDMALNDLPLEKRLHDAPLRIDLKVDRPQLASFNRWQPALPNLSGTLVGSLGLHGAYHRLDLDTRIQLHQFGLPGALEQITAPLHLVARMEAAPSVQALGEALSRGDLAPIVRQLEVRMPSLRAQLPRSGAPPQSVQLQQLLLQAEGGLRPQGIHATLHTLSVQAKAFDLPAINLLLKASMTPEAVELQQMQLRLPQSELRGHGKFAFDTQQLRFRVALPRLQLDAFIRQLPSTLPSEVRGEIDVQGHLQAPKVTARLQYAGARITSDIEAQLHGALPRYAASIRIQDLDTGRFLPGAAGALQATLSLRGSGISVDQRQASLDVQVDANRFSLLPGLSTRLRARVDGAAVRLEQLRVQSVPATLNASGSLSAARRLDLTYRLQLGDLTPLQAPLGMSGLQAKGTLAGHLKGPLDTIQAYSELRIDDWHMANWGGKALRAEVSADNLPAKPQATLKVQVDDVQGPSLPSSSFRIAGDYQAPRGAFTAEVVQGPYQQTQLAGEVVYQQELQIVLDRLRLHGHGLAWENDGAIELVRDAQGAVRLPRLRLRSGDQAITAQGTLSRNGRMAADLSLRQLQIQPLLRTVAPAVAQPDGQLSLDLELSGSVEQPQLEGELGLTALQWQQHDLGDIRGRIGLTGETLQTDLRWRDAQAELLHLHGTLGVGTAGRMALQVQSTAFDMRKLEPFSPAIIESAGSLMLDLQLAGTLLQPQLHGQIEWRDGALQLAPTGERYRDIQVDLRFVGERLDIARMQVGSRSGDLQFAGYVEHAGRQLRQIDLSVQADTFTAVYTHDLQAVVSTDVTASGSLQDLLVTGNITVPRARYRLSGKLGGGPEAVEPWELTVEGVYGRGAKAATTTHDSETAARPQAPLPFLRTDLSIEIPRNVWVQGAGTAVEIQGDLQVTKDLQAPFIVNGTVQTVRGFASFYGKKFVLQKGQVTFPGSEEVNPFLDVTTTHKVSDYLVTIQVEGKAKQPQLTLSSEPELEQADIVSLLVFGKTTDRLTSSEQGALSSQTQSVAGGVAAGMLEKTVGKSLGLDTIEVESGQELGTGRVGVGRYVTQDIFVTYERQFGKTGEGGNTVGVEYNLKGNLKVKGSSSDLGESAIDLLWSIDY